MESRNCVFIGGSCSIRGRFTRRDIKDVSVPSIGRICEHFSSDDRVVNLPSLEGYHRAIEPSGGYKHQANQLTTHPVTSLDTLWTSAK